MNSAADPNEVIAILRLIAHILCWQESAFITVSNFNVFIMTGLLTSCDMFHKRDNFSELVLDRFLTFPDAVSSVSRDDLRIAKTKY